MSGRCVLYPIGKQLYINLTNRCTLRCTFCPKWQGDWNVVGYNLRLAREPSVESVLGELSRRDLHAYRQVVFCGLGEPTMRLQAVLELGRRLRQRGVQVRLNTDGLASFRAHRDVTPELREAVDEVSVSLNAPNPVAYARVCPSRIGQAAHGEVLAFLCGAELSGLRTTATVVELPGLDIAACKQVTELIGVPLRVRPLDRIGAPSKIAG